MKKNQKNQIKFYILLGSLNFTRLLIKGLKKLNHFIYQKLDGKIL